MLVTDISSGGEAPGEVTYGEAFTVQPFGNSLVTKTMTGDMIRRVLEQQFARLRRPDRREDLQISSTLSYESNPSAATCAAKIGRIWVNGVTGAARPTRFRVTMNNFIATGGDGFTVFNEGTDALGGAQDIDALVAYFAANNPPGSPCRRSTGSCPPARSVARQPRGHNRIGFGAVLSRRRCRCTACTCRSNTTPNAAASPDPARLHSSSSDSSSVASGVGSCPIPHDVRSSRKVPDFPYKRSCTW